MKGVLHVRSTIGMYGAEKVVLNLMTAFRDLNFKSFVVTIEGANPQSQDFSNQLYGAKLPYRSIVSKKRFDLHAIYLLRSIIRDKKITIIHTHDYKSLLFSCMAKLFLNIKIVHHIHGALGNTKSEKFYAWIEKLCMHRVAKIITVSTKQKNQLSEYSYFKNKVLQIDNGTVIPEKRKEIASGGVFTIAMVARFTPEKNHEMAIAILESLVSHKKNVRLLLLGDGPCFENIKYMVKKKNLIEFVEFVGFTSQVQEWLYRTDLLLMTSLTEGMPMCLLESMAIGLPTVSTPVGEIPKLLSESESGTVANDIEGLTQAIIEFMDDTVLYRQCSKNARQFTADNLSVTRQAKKLSELYSEISGETL